MGVAVGAVGITVYSYDAAGQLLSENGPWADDTARLLLALGQLLGQFGFSRRH